ncbi:MAG TPA: PDZ domain-containing protein, partial [Blastocatellia bacterium]|nr:PDZ domain-containing protein [Blastocatellia bacterium]
ILGDSPTEIGTHKLLEFTALGKPHRIAIWGTGNYDEAKLIDDFTKIVEQGAAIFGGLPYDHYTFIIHLQHGLTHSGLEHLNSTVCQAPPNTFRPQGSYARFLDLIAHEHFHLWNVKHIRPATLGPFDYQRENYTQSLWFSEGVTDYYAQVLLRRAALISPATFLENKATEILTYETTPGHRKHSPAEASFDAWIKYYRPDENSVNTSFSYYTSGALLGWMLDFEIRSRTNGAKTLDDVMRYLYENYALKNRGSTESELKAAFETVAGGDLSDFFNRYIYGREEFPFDKYLEMAGLKRTPVYLPSTYDDPSRTPQPRGSLGIRTKFSGDRVIVSNVLDGTPAYTVGINANDELVALNGEKVDATNLNERLSRLQPNQAISVVVFRRDRLMTFNLTTAQQQPDRYIINANPKEDTPAILKLRQSWLQDAKK